MLMLLLFIGLLFW